MKRNTIHIVLAALLVIGTLPAVAQKKTCKAYLREGNRAYRDSTYQEADIRYRKALELDGQVADAHYNLGNALFRELAIGGGNMEQEELKTKAQELVGEYQAAAQIETDKGKKAHIFHNVGNMMYLTQNYQGAVEAYMESLRNNPADDETRYNLAKAMYMLKQQQQDGGGQDQQQDQQQAQQEQQDQQQQQQQEQQQQEQQAEQQQAEQKDDEISKENAEQMLQAIMQDEKELQDKLQRKDNNNQGNRKLEKNW